MICDLCHDKGWFFYLHWKTNTYEVKHCDQCHMYRSDQAAGIVASVHIAESLRTAEILTETRIDDEWAMETIPCGTCFKKGWYLRSNNEKIIQLLKCSNCSIYTSHAEAGQSAFKQIIRAFDLVKVANKMRREDAHLRLQTAKAFGEVRHQWMTKEKRNARE